MGECSVTLTNGRIGGGHVLLREGRAGSRLLRVMGDKATLRTAVQAGLFTSINYLTFPGFTDRRSELDHLLALIRETGFHMIQWKNLNIDPDLYESLIGKSGEERLGMRRMVEEVRKAFPEVAFGYFNRPRAETISRPKQEERDPSRGLRTNTR